MKKSLLQLEQYSLVITKEYCRLIALPILSSLEAERIGEILELANNDEFINFLIEKIEIRDYLKSYEST